MYDVNREAFALSPNQLQSLVSDLGCGVGIDAMLCLAHHTEQRCCSVSASCHVRA
jgi:hypothetical protein